MVKDGGSGPTCPHCPQRPGSATKEVVSECSILPASPPPPPTPPPSLNSVKQHINRQPVHMSAGTSRFKNDHHASSRLPVWSRRHDVSSHRFCCCCDLCHCQEFETVLTLTAALRGDPDYSPPVLCRLISWINLNPFLVLLRLSIKG